ncbi:hypothetical protein ABFS83_12G089400 [Erythranthe nasuta]
MIWPRVFVVVFFLLCVWISYVFLVYRKCNYRSNDPELDGLPLLDFSRQGLSYDCDIVLFGYMDLLSCSFYRVMLLPLLLSFDGDTFTVGFGFLAWANTNRNDWCLGFGGYDSAARKLLGARVMNSTS